MQTTMSPPIDMLPAPPPPPPEPHLMPSPMGVERHPAMLIDQDAKEERFRQQQHYCRAAIALNNMAVTMVERQNFRQAYETFKDAAFALKVQSRLAENGGLGKVAGRQAELDDELLDRLDDAYHRSACPELHPPPLHLRVIDHDGPLRPEFYEVRKENPALCGYTLIRIETTDVELLDTAADMELLHSVMQYNYAVATVCRAKIAKDPMRERKLLDGAIKLLTSSLKRLGTLFEECEDPYQMPRVIFSSAIVIQTLIRTLLLKGQHDKAQSYVTTLLTLRTAASEFDDPEFAAPSADSNCAAAA